MSLRIVARLTRCHGAISGRFNSFHRNFADLKSRERRYVRLSGLSQFAVREDIVQFLRMNDIDVSRVVAGASARLMYEARAPIPNTDDRDSDVKGGAPVVSTETESPEGDTTSHEGTLSKYALTSVPNRDSYLAVGDQKLRACDIPLLCQTGTDSFLNQAIWAYDAGTEEQARETCEKLSGKICGLRLVRVSVTDERILREYSSFRRSSLSSSESSHPSFHEHIAPGSHERDRAIFLYNLPSEVPARFIWAFFGMYDVSVVRLLRKQKIVSVVFRTPDEAQRAIRERQNLPLHGRGRTAMRMH